MVSFAELSLTSFLAERLQQAGFTAPTPIQKRRNSIGDGGP